MPTYEVVKDNFLDLLPTIKKNIDRAAFIGTNIIIVHLSLNSSWNFLIDVISIPAVGRSNSLSQIGEHLPMVLVATNAHMFTMYVNFDHEYEKTSLLFHSFYYHDFFEFIYSY